jgi:hypothetical protein
MGSFATICVGALCFATMAPTYGWTDSGHRHIYSKKQCIQQSDGSVKLTAIPTSTKEWRSCGLSSRDAGQWFPLEGTVSVTASLPHRSGMWPALWLRARGGAGIGEIDLVEVFPAGWSDATQSVHAPRFARTLLLAKGVMIPNRTGRHTWWARIKDTAVGVRVTVGVDKRTTGTTVIRGKSATELRKAGKWDLAANLAVSCSRWIGCPKRSSGSAVMTVYKVQWRP